MLSKSDDDLVKQRRKVLLQQLTSKFGVLPSTTVSHVNQAESLEWLDTYLDRKHYATSLDEMYWELPREEGSSLFGTLPSQDYKAAWELVRRFTDTMREEGRKQGYEEGMREIKLKVLIQQIHNKFGPIPEDTVARLEAVKLHEELTTYLDRVPTAKSLEELLRPVPVEDREVTRADELREEGRQIGRRAAASLKF